MNGRYNGHTRVIVAFVLAVVLLIATSKAIYANGPTLNLSPSSGPIGTKVTVSICNIPPGAIVDIGNITFADTPWNRTPITADSSGCTWATMLSVPVVSAEAHAVMVKSGQIRATGFFTVTRPNIDISPTSGYRGQTVIVTGSGWPQGLPGVVTLTIDGSHIEDVALSSTGTFSAKFTLPLTAKESTAVGAEDNLGNKALERSFSLKPAELTLSPASGSPGTSVVATGVGFQPFSYVEELKVANISIPLNGLTTNEVGTFTATFTVPGLTNGCQIVSATVAGSTLTKCLTVLAPETPVNQEIVPLFLLEESLASINDKLIVVWGYYEGEWHMYDPADPIGSSLEGLVKGRGYLVKVSERCSLGIRELYAGWNNIGW